MSETVLGFPLSDLNLSVGKVAILGHVRPISVVCHTLSLQSIGTEHATLSSGQPSDANYPAVNVAFYVPFGVAGPTSVSKMIVRNGTAVAGNLDVGIYLPDGTKVVSMGSTAQSGVSAFQAFDITDTVLVRGRYYMGISSDTSGVTQKVLSGSFIGVRSLQAMGVYTQATAFPLPSPAVFATPTQSRVPQFGWAGRTLAI